MFGFIGVVNFGPVRDDGKPFIPFVIELIFIPANSTIRAGKISFTIANCGYHLCHAGGESHLLVTFTSDYVVLC